MSNKQIPETSREAYKSLDPATLNERYQRILWALGQIGEGTFQDVAKVLKLPDSVIWKRLSDLGKWGLIYRPGNKKILSSGRAGFTWKVVKNGESQPTTEKSLPGKTVSHYSKVILQSQLF